MANSFAEIIFCRDKKELKQLCKTLTVHRDDFVDFVIACKAGLTHLNHTMHYWDYVPDYLVETEDDYAVLSASREVQSSPEGQKSLRKLFKAHGQRKYKVAHMFFSREIKHPLSEWHMVFFEMEELKDKGNHWCGGAHVHITNYLWPNLYCQDLWDDFLARKTFPKSKLHLSFLDETRNKNA